jgi:hypothetical protein
MFLLKEYKAPQDMPASARLPGRREQGLATWGNKLSIFIFEFIYI